MSSYCSTKLALQLDLVSDIKFNSVEFQLRALPKRNTKQWLYILRMYSSRKYPYSPYGRFFCLAPPPPPGNSRLFSYISSKNLAFKTPLPLGISNDLLWGGYGFFLEPHNHWSSALRNEKNITLLRLSTVEQPMNHSHQGATRTIKEVVNVYFLII